MRQSLTEAVDAILRRLEEVPESPLTEHGIRSWLAGQGYSKRDIEDAIKLVKPQIRTISRMPQPARGALRHLSILDVFRMTPEAKTALTRLELYEMIEPHERDLLLDRMSQIEGEIGLDDLDYLLSWILCTTRDVESQQTIYNVFEGNAEGVH
ncbi:MAG: DUF494 family protein [Candidatus Hydrogenedentes bacterium]|nr:DUF494 family protein [Candidatus Hydrogenedentota bacterium]